MNILIIEDNKVACDRLIKQINELRPDYVILECIQNIDSAIKWFISNPEPDLVFLDVQLTDGTCFEIFKETSISAPVIFITAFDEYTMKAFELNSIDYLLKPVNIDKLSAAFMKFEKMKDIFGKSVNENQILNMFNSLQLNQQPYRLRFLVPRGDGYYPVLTKHISYFYAEDNCIFIVTKNNEKFSIHYSLDKLEKELNPKIFWRANRSFIVSAESIVKAHNYFNYKIKLELEPKAIKDVIISRKKANDFKAWFNS